MLPKEKQKMNNNQSKIYNNIHNNIFESILNHSKICLPFNINITLQFQLNLCVWGKSKTIHDKILNELQKTISYDNNNIKKSKSNNNK